MMNLERALSAAIERVAKDGGVDTLPALQADTPLMDYFDSLGLLNIVMTTESELETRLGRYVMLADDTLMDAVTSPFRTFGSWCAYVQGQIGSA